MHALGAGGALAAASIALALGAHLAAEQTPTPSASLALPCGITDLDDFRLAVGPGQVLGGHDLTQGEDLEPYPLDDERDQALGEGRDRLDLVAGDDLRVEASESDPYSGESRRIPNGSVAATLDLEGAPPIWLAVEMGTDGTASLRMPAIATTGRRLPPVLGDGILAVRVGLCDGWSQAAYARVTVVDPTTITDCPTAFDAVWPYIEGLDRRVRVGRGIVPGRAIWDAHGRYADPPPYVAPPGAMEGVRYRPASPAVRVRAGRELHVRHVDREIDLVDARVEWVDPPAARELREGLVTSLDGHARKAQTRPDGSGGYFVRAPQKPGRYMLFDHSTWTNHCVRITEGPMIVIVKVR